MLLQSRDAGLVTDWLVKGPYGRNTMADMRKAWPPERESSKQGTTHRNERESRFANGLFVLPSTARDGVFYASARIYLASDGEWNVWTETAGSMQIFVDGKAVVNLEANADGQARAVRQSVRLPRGAHTLQAKFTRPASPFRVAVMPPTGGVRNRHNNIPLEQATPESQVLSASLR